ncbi:hypothetical protein NQZ68_007179 [Dissostichus eleginoides]|nr:hypothetical protein NQZ68_007179 [Dissostichus eleginoides]
MPLAFGAAPQSFDGVEMNPAARPVAVSARPQRPVGSRQRKTAEGRRRVELSGRAASCQVDGNDARTRTRVDISREQETQQSQ